MQVHPYLVMYYNLFDKNMNKRLILSLCLSVCFLLEANAQLLYKISGKGLSRPSYVLGTCHLVNGSFSDSIPGLRNALSGTDQVYGEVVMSEMTSPENMQKLKASMSLPDSTSLQKLLTEDQMARLNAFLKEIIGVDLSNEGLKVQFGQLKPAALSTQLTILMYMRKHTGELNIADLLDQHLQAVAVKSGKKVGGLETLDFQMNLLYGQPMPRQIEGLMCLVDNGEEMLKMTEEMIKAYYAMDIKTLKQVMDRKMHNSCDQTPEEEKAMVYDRNARWARKMPGVMAQASTLFVVGSGHLPGDKGLLQLLRQAGYTIEAVK